MRHGKLLTMLALGALLAGCVEEPQRGGSGQLVVDLSTSTELNVVATRAGVAGELPSAVVLPDADEFSLRITGDENGFARNYAAIPSEPVTLEAGDYSATASYGDPDEEGFGKPCFEATESFTIEWKTDENPDPTFVELEAKLTNMAVSIDPTEAFTEYFADYSVEIMRGETQIVEFEKGETDIAFIKPQTFKVKINYTSRLGVDKSVESNISADVAACTWQKLILDVPDVNAGEITITWNDNTEVVELDPIDVGDPE